MQKLAALAVVAGALIVAAVLASPLPLVVTQPRPPHLEQRQMSPYITDRRTPGDIWLKADTLMIEANDIECKPAPCPWQEKRAQLAEPPHWLVVVLGAVAVAAGLGGIILASLLLGATVD
jgi:hypothetical protein